MFCQNFQLPKMVNFAGQVKHAVAAHVDLLRKIKLLFAI